MARQGRRDKDGKRVAAEAGSVPMINRTLELELLREHLAQVARGEPGRAVLLLGESGVGKSRLAGEVIAEAKRVGMSAITAQCLGRGAEPLLPLKDALTTYLGHSPERMRRTLIGAAPRLLDAIPFIGKFLGRIGDSLLAGHSFRGASLDGVYEEVARILTGVSEKSGLCLLVEDLHAADRDTLFFLNYFLRKVRDSRIVAIFTIQEEQLLAAPDLADLVAQWTAEGYAILTILPLERAHVGEYVQKVAALGIVPDEAFVDRLFSLTGGNPFFLKESLQLLAQSSSPGAGPAEVPLTVPRRVEAVLQRRLEKAEGTTRGFIEAAAVVLETAQELEPIAYVMEAETGTAIRALAVACDLRLMQEGPHGEVGFVHFLMQREVYTRMGANYRRYLHLRAAEWFERAGRFASAAFHFERAEGPDDMVRTAMRAAAQAEQSGMFHSALMLYQKVRPHVEIEEIGPLLGRALVTLGNWDQAQELVDRLPASDGRVRLLRSELRFVRSDFRGARDEAEAALDDGSADRLQVLIRLADIGLYLGEFPDAARYGRAALAEAERSGGANARARCLGILGATEFFGGNIDEGETYFLRALDLLTRAPDDDRDVTVQTTLLGNLGNIAEARADWVAAERYQGQALRLRREVADARGALHSLHALGRARIGLGDAEGGFALFAETEQLATDLGETLERAKVTHSRAELRRRENDCRAALELATAAFDVFSRSSTHYDVAHTLVTLSAAALDCGLERDGVVHGAAARSSIEADGYGLLRHLYPGVAYPLADRIAGGLTAYACGDALGLPYENFPPSGAADEQIEQLAAREGWARGATSDDTALTVMVARHLADRRGEGDARSFLATLAEQAPSINGLGPSTMEAIRRYRATGELPVTGGETNGGPLRALPVGWVTPLGAAERRRRLAIEMTRATHPNPETQCAACVVAACGSWALEGAGYRMLLEVAIEEEREAAAACGASGRLGQLLEELAADTWRAPEDGVSLDPAETVTAALACLTRASSLREALVQAVRLGGDTDTVAAIAGGILGSGMTRDEVLAELPWHAGVLLPDAGGTAEIAAVLASTRALPAGQPGPASRSAAT